MEVTNLKWADIRRHLIKAGIKVAKTACCPGCTESNFEDNETYVFVRQDNIKEFNARLHWGERYKTDNLNIYWGGNATDICRALKELPFFVEWDGDQNRTISATLKAQA